VRIASIMSTVPSIPAFDEALAAVDEAIATFSIHARDREVRTRSCKRSSERNANMFGVETRWNPWRPPRLASVYSKIQVGRMKKLAVASIGFGGSGRKAERRIDGRTAVARMEFGRRPSTSVKKPTMH